MRRVILLNDAKQDLVLIKKFSEKNWGIEQSLTYLRVLKQTIDLINSNPKIGTNRTDISIQLFSFPIKSHVIYYMFSADTTWIIRVLHKSMLPKNHLKD